LPADIVLSPAEAVTLSTVDGKPVLVAGQWNTRVVICGRDRLNRKATTVVDTCFVVTDSKLDVGAVLGESWLRGRASLDFRSGMPVLEAGGLRVPCVQPSRDAGGAKALWYPPLERQGDELMALRAAALAQVGASLPEFDLERRWSNESEVAGDMVDPDKAEVPAQQQLDDLQARYEREEKEEVERMSDEEKTRACDAAERLVAELEAATAEAPASAEVYNLSAGGKARLFRAIKDLASQFTSPRMVRRRIDAADLGLPLELELKPEAKPNREGLARRFSEEKIREIIRQVAALERIGLVEKADSSQWSSAVLMVKKANGGWRFCVDFRKVNEATKPCEYPLPDMEEIIKEVARKGRIFGVYDLTDAFYHLSIAEGSRDILSFEVPQRGRYRWTVLPMGVRDAPGLFQKTMEDIFRPLLGKGVRIFIDDLVIYACDEREYLRLTGLVHAVMTRFDLRVNAAKCQLARTKISLLGRTVSYGTISPDEDSVKVLATFPQPSTIGGMQRFRGLLNYYSDYLPGAAPHLANLMRVENAARNGRTMTTRDPTPVEWDEEATASFEWLRAALSSSPCVVVPPADKLEGRLRIETDAATAGSESVGGLGGVVQWQDDEGRWRLVQAFHRVLQKPEKKYTPTEVEMCGIIYACKKAAWVLRTAKRVRVVTDHQALVFLSRLAESEHGRLSRWAAKLIEFDLVLEYRPGKLAVVPDAFSRALEAIVPAGSRLTDALAKAGEVQGLCLAALETHCSDFVEQLMELGDAQFEWALVDWPWRYEGDRRELWFRRADRVRLTELRTQLDRVMAADAVVVMCSTAVKVEEAVLAMAGGDWQLYQSWVWVKPRSCRSRHGARTSHELFLCFVRGDRRAIIQRAEQVEGTIYEQSREPGRKPEGLYRLIDALAAPGCRRLEVFAREKRPDWVAVGDETGKFDRQWLAASSLLAEQKEEDILREAALTASLFVLTVAGGRELLRRSGIPVKPEEMTRAASERLSKQVDQIQARIQPSIDTQPVPASSVIGFMETKGLVECPVFSKDEGRWAARSLDSIREDPGLTLLVPVLMCGAMDDAVFVPRTAIELWVPLIRQLHKLLTHAGSDRVVAALPSTGYWGPGLKETVTQLLSKCIVCQQQKGGESSWKPRKEIQRSVGTVRAPALFASVHLDHMIMGKKSARGYTAILTISDAFSRKRILVPVRTVTAEETGKALYECWIRFFGWPARFTSDQGSAFTSNILSAACARAGVGQSFTTPYHPQANGVEERLHRTVREWLALAIQECGLSGSDWDLALPAVELTLNTTVHKSTGYAPDEIVFGITPTLPLHLRSKRAQRLCDERFLAAQWLMEQSASASGDVRARAALNTAIEAMLGVRAEIWDRVLVTAAKADFLMQRDGIEGREKFKEGDYVFVFEPEALALSADESLPNKLQEKRWSGPWRVIASVRGAALVVARANRPENVRSVSVLRVKRAYLEGAERERFEVWWKQLDEEDKKERLRLKEAKERVVYFDESKTVQERWGVDRVLAVKGRGRQKRARVLWDNGEITEEPYDIIREDAPDAIREFEDSKNFKN
jgi:N6-adenosine-specific RNA methylase IME4